MTAEPLSDKVLAEMRGMLNAVAKPLIPAHVALLLAEVADLRARLEAAERDRDEARFRPMGDNHHNAAACPHCNPRRGELEARWTAARDAAVARAESAESERDALRRELDEIRRSLNGMSELLGAARADRKANLADLDALRAAAVKPWDERLCRLVRVVADPPEDDGFGWELRVGDVRVIRGCLDTLESKRMAILRAILDALLAEPAGAEPMSVFAVGALMREIAESTEPTGAEAPSQEQGSDGHPCGTLYRPDDRRSGCVLPRGHGTAHLSDTTCGPRVAWASLLSSDDAAEAEAVKSDARRGDRGHLGLGEPRPVTVAPSPEPARPCGTCGGSGLVLYVIGEDGYWVSDPCPDCRPRGEVGG